MFSSDLGDFLKSLASHVGPSTCLHLESIYCTGSKPGRTRIEKYRDFYPKGLTPALLAENANMLAFASIVLSNAPPFCYSLGSALRNGLCVRVKCIHLFRRVAAGNVLCMCFVGREGKTFIFAFCFPR